MSKKCPRCKGEIDEKAKICPHCNEPLTFWEHLKASRKSRSQRQEQCCGCTVPRGCSPCASPCATTPLGLTLSSMMWSVFLYSAGTLHCLFSLIGISDFYQRCVRFYQNNISSRISARCNLEPTCSQYSLEVVEEYGIYRGLHLTLERLRLCAQASNDFKSWTRGDTSKSALSSK